MNHLKIFPQSFNELSLLEQRRIIWANDHGIKIFRMIDGEKELLPEFFEDWNPFETYVYEKDFEAFVNIPGYDLEYEPLPDHIIKNLEEMEKHFNKKSFRPQR